MSNLDKEKNYKIKPIFIIGVPRCGSTMIEKIIGSGQKFIPMGEETSILENFVNTKILQQQSLNLGKVEEVRNELFEIFKRNGLVSEKYNFTFIWDSIFAKVLGSGNNKRNFHIIRIQVIKRILFE